MVFIDPTDEELILARLRQLPYHSSGMLFVTLVARAIAMGTAIIDHGGKYPPIGLIIAHRLPDWQSLPIYPDLSYALAQQIANEQGYTLGNAEEIWTELEEVELLIRAWNGKPIAVQWRNDTREAFIIPLTLLGMALQQHTDFSLSV